MCNRAGAPWSSAEEYRLMNYVRCGWPLMKIADQHQRTRGGIESRLLKLGADLNRMPFSFFDGCDPPQPIWYHNEEGEFKVRTEPTSRIKGRFWMIQNDGLTGNKDSYGHARLSWPGASIFATKAEAIEAAREMAARQPSDKFYVMEAVSLIETTQPPVKVTNFKKVA